MEPTQDQEPKEQPFVADLDRDRFEVGAAWMRFLLDLEFAQNYHLVHAADGGRGFRNPVLERLLPALLYIKLAAALDEGLAVELGRRGVVLPIKVPTGEYRDTFGGRIRYLVDVGELPVRALEVGGIRNAIAHELGSGCRWETLERAVELVHDVFQRFGFVGARPDLEAFAERVPVSEPVDITSISAEDYVLGIREPDGPTLAEFRWRAEIERDAKGLEG